MAENRSLKACPYCGSARVSDAAVCLSCGAQMATAAPMRGVQIPARPAQNSFKGFLIWLLLGLFGGYAYWSGQKQKAYRRGALWLTALAGLGLTMIAHQADGKALSLLFFFVSAGSLLTVFLLWVFDLAHLLRR